MRILDGKELHLTPSEYKLLCLLCRNVGKVLTHTFITQQIWGRSWENDIASLRVFMATLRKSWNRNPALPVYPDPYRSGVSDDEGGIKLRTGLQDTPEAVQNAETRRSFS